MREYSAPALRPIADDENASDVVWANAERFGDTVSFRRRVDGSWHDVTAREFAAEVTAVAKGLLAAGIEQGDRIGLMSKTRYEWTLLDFAIWAAGGVTVPIYETSSAEQIHWILSNSGAKGIVVETAEHRATLDEVTERLPELAHTWQIEGDSPAVDTLSSTGGDRTDDELHARRRAVKADDVATICYTSGTTGRPKGVTLTHRNLLSEVRADIDAFPDLMESGNSLLLFLPLAHILARAIALTAFASRVTLGHTDTSDLVADLGAFRPTFVVAVPRVFEKVYNSAKLKAHASGKGKIFDAAEATAIEYSQATDAGKVGLGLKLKHAVFAKLVYSKLHAALGSRCIAAVSGGAPLGTRLAHFFRGIGVPVFEGYGLTETTAAAAVNTREAFKVGTVGRPVKGTSARIAEDGEVLLSGGVVFGEYWRNEEATAESLEDGWFHTGDLGEIDDEGFLKITGRKKEIIVTAGGKNVAPSTMEDTLKAHPLISQAMVVGDQRPFIAALVTIDEEFFPTWKEQNGKPADATVADLADDEQLRADVQSAVDEANKLVSHAESIKKFTVLPKDFTEAGGEVTPSMKLKRNVVSKNYAGDIDSLYAK
ncbi:AMP-dependent synthetase/ligase [Prauserella rugosa]|uniref:Acyl-CoA synthetase n=1 Tax=Prauserella rugosa TaxID=43354 RepID=A0A660CBS6_9PSEU|nr:AMP-dependent synthetase/ligase [Prauserella rugosa]KMS85580.1 long-chain fatty acid--CoA ligase [Streptomyces regensis]TWH18979.1 long-chain acyl-CoA synthetase [Prauserella rugosa]